MLLLLSNHCKQWIRYDAREHTSISSFVQSPSHKAVTSFGHSEFFGSNLQIEVPFGRWEWLVVGRGVVVVADDVLTHCIFHPLTGYNHSRYQQTCATLYSRRHARNLPRVRMLRWTGDNNNNNNDGRRRRRRRTRLVWCNLSNRYMNINALLESDSFVSVRVGWRDRKDLGGVCAERGNDYLQHHNWQIKYENREFIILSRLRNQRMVEPLVQSSSNLRSGGDSRRLAGTEGVVPRYRESLEWTQKGKECWRDRSMGMRLSLNTVTSSATRWWWTLEAKARKRASLSWSSAHHFSRMESLYIVGQYDLLFL